VKLHLQKVTVLLASTLFTVAAVFWWSRSPHYEGKSLSDWVAALKSANPRRQEQAQQALRKIGPQAVPFLLRMAREEGSMLKGWYREAWFRLPDSVRIHVGQPESGDAALSFISHALHQTYGLFPPEHRSSLLLRGGTSDAQRARGPDRGFEVADFQLDCCFGFPSTILFERKLVLFAHFSAFPSWVQSLANVQGRSWMCTSSELPLLPTTTKNTNKTAPCGLHSAPWENRFSRVYLWQASEAEDLARRLGPLGLARLQWPVRLG
jgi:hypothetical protein